jgi:hypothetical protein
MVIEFMEHNQTLLREMSLRMALKIADLTRVSDTNWRALAATTCMKNSYGDLETVKYMVAPG